MDYNPHTPGNLGMEWVPIREEEGVLFDSGRFGADEYGTVFQLATSRTPTEARYYTEDVTQGVLTYPAVNIYPRGTENLSGPIQRLIIPASSGGITGAGASLSGASSVAEALAAPSDGKTVIVALNIDGVTSTITNTMRVFFGVSTYLPELLGKRILAVNILAHAYGDAQQFVDDAVAIDTLMSFDYDIGPALDASSSPNPAWGFETDFTTPGTITTSPVWGIPLDQLNDITPQNIARFSMGNYNNRASQLWTPNNLARFEQSAASRIAIMVRSSVNRSGITSTISQNMNWDYMALEVFYCEEQRVSMGATSTINTSPQMRAITLMSPTGGATPSLPAGSYTITATAATVGTGTNAERSNPNLPYTGKGLREYESIPGIAGRRVQIPGPFDENVVGKELTVSNVPVLPQLSLHTASATLTEPHGYGDQAAARVYGSNIASQLIDDTIAGGLDYKQVRFYARRFGDTTVPLKLSSASATVSGSSVQITPAEWDELDPIIDGWKQINLRFTTAPRMAQNINTTWQWTATGETVGNRWEVLGAVAPALSGTPGNLLNKVVSGQRLDSTTYGGSTALLTWLPGLAPLVSASTADSQADATLVFAQDMPTVTGFTVGMATQPLTGIGLNCEGGVACCQPQGFLYNNITWNMGMSDQFQRTAVSDWGTADTGETWTTSGSNTTFSVDSTGGHIVMSAAGASPQAVIGAGIADQDLRVKFVIPNVLPVGASYAIGGLVRWSGGSAYYAGALSFTTSNTVTLEIFRRDAGFTTLAGPVQVAPSFRAGDRWNMRIVALGTRILAKAWLDGQDEPGWLVAATDTTYPVQTGAGLRPEALGGSTALPLDFTVEEFSVSPVNLGAYELQRMDAVDTDWKAVMLSETNAPFTYYFRDYEARVGIQSSYRIRAIDLMGFEGPWSSTQSITLTAPGATGGSCVSEGHVLLFSSNANQDGVSNLAYAEAWMGSGAVVEEPFDFPEAGMNQAQMMYGKNFPTMFRPLERGGEQFTRTILVQAASIAAPTLGDFTNLRDMAWDDTPYVCVRDEEGNRWFATVEVPDGNVMRDRQLYLATVRITETSEDPYPVDP